MSRPSDVAMRRKITEAFATRVDPAQPVIVRCETLAELRAAVRAGGDALQTRYMFYRDTRKRPHSKLLYSFVAFDYDPSTIVDSATETGGVSHQTLP